MAVARGVTPRADPAARAIATTTKEATAFMRLLVLAGFAVLGRLHGLDDQFDASIRWQPEGGRGLNIASAERAVSRQILVEVVGIAGLGVVGVQLIALAVESADALHAVVERRLDLVDGALELAWRRRRFLQGSD